MHRITKLELRRHPLYRPVPVTTQPSRLSASLRSLVVGGGLVAGFVAALLGTALRGLRPVPKR